MPNPITGQPWPWEPQASAPAAPDTSKRDKVSQDLQGQFGELLGDPSEVTVMGTGAQANTPLGTGYYLYTFKNGASIEVNNQGDTRNYKPPSTAQANADKPTQITANTTDPKIVMMDPVTKQTVTVDNPNYKQPTDTSVAGNTTEPNILSRKPDGTLVWQQNPNYKPPVGTSVSANTTDPNIVTRNADGTLTTSPNPNYQPPAAAPISANTTDPTIVLRDPKTGAITTQPNPNYQPAAAAPIASNTTDQFITLRDPKTGAISTQPNPNYQKPAANVVGSPGTGDQFILSRDPTTGTVTPQPNPNYVPPKPTQITPSATTPYITTQDAKGNLTSIPNPSYIPTDPGRMTAQLKQQADAQWQSLQQQVGTGQITGDQALSQMNKYWDENIEPVKGDIAAAQAKAQAALQYQQAQTGYEQGLTAMLPANLAETASNNAQARAISMMPYMVNASAQNGAPTITTGARGFPQINTNQIMQNATFSLPNLQEIGRQGAAAALANISPTAAMHAQMPGPPAQPPAPGMPDLNSLLNRSQYGAGPGGSVQMPYYPGQGGGPQLTDMFNRGAYPGMPPQGPAPTMPQGMPPGAGMPPAMPPQPPAPPPFDWAGLLARQQQSAQDQAAQAQFQWPAYQPAA